MGQANGEDEDEEDAAGKKQGEDVGPGLGELEKVVEGGKSKFGMCLRYVSVKVPCGGLWSSRGGFGVGSWVLGCGCRLPDALGVLGNMDLGSAQPGLPRLVKKTAGYLQTA